MIVPREWSQLGILKLNILAFQIRIPVYFVFSEGFPWGQLPSPSHIYHPLSSLLVFDWCVCVCAYTFTRVSVSMLALHCLCTCLLMHAHLQCVCVFLTAGVFYDVYFFLFLVQESPSGPLGIPVPACQKRLHLLDPLEAGDSQMSLGPSTEWWEEDSKRRMWGEEGGGRRGDRKLNGRDTKVREGIWGYMESLRWRSWQRNDMWYSVKLYICF